jgi:hypothetical protein
MKRKNWYPNDHLPRKIDLGLILKIENEKKKLIFKCSLTKKNRSSNHPKDRKRKEEIDIQMITYQEKLILESS